MKYIDLKKINKLYFTPKDIAWALGISEASARVSAWRYSRQGLLVRVKRNFYVLRERWERLSDEESFQIANILEVPSYVSFTTALSFYDATTQIQRGFYESVSLKRTKEIEIEGRVFRFTRIKKELYSNFARREGYFLALPEKALLDSIYLTAQGKYHLDTSALDVDKFDKNKIAQLIKKYPARVSKLWRGYVGSL